MTDQQPPTCSRCGTQYEGSVEDAVNYAGWREQASGELFCDGCRARYIDGPDAGDDGDD